MHRLGALNGAFISLTPRHLAPGDQKQEASLKTKNKNCPLFLLSEEKSGQFLLCNY